MLNKNEEAKYAEMRERCAALGMPSPPEIIIGLRVVDKNGVLVFDDKQRGHSWTRNFYNLMFGALFQGVGGGSNNFGAGYMSAKRTGGTVDYSSSYSASAGKAWYATGYYICNNGANNSYGIVVGTGDTAFDEDHYVMAAIIAHGNGAGQLAYNAQSAAASAYVAGSKTWKATHSRIFNNNSGDTIVVKETGIYMTGGDANSMFINRTTDAWLLERTVLSPTASVANGAQLTVTYEMSIDFSAID